MSKQVDSMFNEDEQDYFEDMSKGKDIQFMLADNTNLFACLDRRKIKSWGFFLCHVTSDRKTCFGKFADKNIQFPNENNRFLRTFVDRRKKDHLKIYVNDNNQCSLYSKKFESNNNNNERFLLYLEDEYFAQIIIFDCGFYRKVSQIIVTEPNARETIRTFAMSYMSLLLPDIKWSEVWSDPKLIETESGHYGEK